MKFERIPTDRPVSETALMVAQTSNALRRLEAAVDAQRHPSPELIEATKNLRFQIASLAHLARRQRERLSEMQNANSQ